MPLLARLAKHLGGVRRIEGGQTWLETKVGDLRAVIVQRSGPVSFAARYDVAVFSPGTRELDPFYPTSEWRLDGPDHIKPRLRTPYVFAGCRGGVLWASSFAPPRLEHVVATLWDLAAWARMPWRALDEQEWLEWQARERRDRKKRVASRLGFVAAAVAVAIVLRRIK